MKRNNFLLILLSLFFVLNFNVSAQDIEGFEKQEIESYKSKAQDQVRFLEYLLNTLGSKDASHRDKDVIIRESYLKIFRDSKVQIEDDLTENRNVLINKDVTAYLKDIEFFFQNAKFDFDIKSTEPFLRDNGGLSFKVELNRTLKAKGIEGESILNTKTRFVEINLDKEKDELQIASIYTTKVSRDEAIIEWWNNLSLGWKDIFRKEIQITEDSVEINQLNIIASIDSLNLSNNNYIVSLAPLSFLVDLRYVNLSHTKIEDISPLSSLTELKHLDISHTAIEDLSFLRYAENMEHLDISFTPVQKINELENLNALEELKLNGADIREFEVLSNFKNLIKLDLSETFFNNPEVFSELNKLEELNMARSNLSKLTNKMSPETLKMLDISFAFISDLSPLEDYKNLKSLNINNTQVESLEPLENLESLEKIYADNTFVSEQEINEFIDANPGKLLVVNSEELSEWWTNLNMDWKDALSVYLEGRVRDNPEKEQLTKLLLKDSLNLNNNGLNELNPLVKFSRLRYLSISNNQIKSLSPIESLNSLSVLEAQNIELNSITSILRLKKLKKLNLAQNQLSEEQFLQLSKMNSLNELNVDKSGIQKEAVRKFLSQKATECSVVYDKEGIDAWWTDLDDTWQSIFKLQFPLSSIPTYKELHDLTAINSIVIMDEPINSLDPLSQFVFLEELYLERVGLENLESISAIKDIKILSIKESPIEDLQPLNQLYQLEKLILNFTAVDDLKPLEEMQDLEYLSLAGTKVKNLKGIGTLIGLKYLDISSTQVRWIGKLDMLTNLEQFICYNTRIFDFSLNNFKEEHPDCSVRFY
ncbi:leucine-rich repeat domain-containing protein [Marivirga salinae]|uniref:Leucine-rich repeat domain-containing protein n=1 Tax=Marivirga salinarum TaxID=3059078 RepID=A0AA51N9E1_9BACT|nr:leucine-rich repeat domain-containing protein [Marivirga sp. BDSF4-3]WMN10884.1 leucine-rich repeat domain-containing protein [Marivirga sp. BDSF4-3]